MRILPAFVLRLWALLLLGGLAWAEDPATFAVGDFTFTRPAAWQWIPVPPSMRKAQLKIGGEADVTFFDFQGDGGNADLNTKRWLGQFTSKTGAEKIDKQEVAGTKITFVSTTGTFASGMPGQPPTPLENYGLHGAIMETAHGSVIVKMTGPVALVEKSREEFAQFITAAAQSKK